MRRAYKKHKIEPDSLYQDVEVSKFINKVMKRGKKTTARKIVYSAFSIIKEKTQKEPLEIFKKALENVSPLLEVKPKRIGGATYQVPMEVRQERKFHLATKWILDAARGKKGKAMHEKLSEELLAASNNEGAAMKKKADTHRMAEANKAFAHFARGRK
jgi:small subunit ribosomal protein S7